MDFCTHHFGKTLDILSFSDVENYFTNSRQEAETLEFKSYSKTEEFEKELGKIIPTINAFLNSDGGILVWGAPKGKNVEGKNEKQFEGELSTVPQDAGKDKIISKITDRVSPMPIGIRVSILNRDRNNYVYIFEIQKSLFKPHQHASIYHVRLDGQTRAAPHYFVEAMMRQIKFPDIRGIIRVGSFYQKDEWLHSLQLTIVFSNLSPFQNEQNISFHLWVSGADFQNPHHHQNSGYSVHGKTLSYNNSESVLHYGVPKEYIQYLNVANTEVHKENSFIELVLTFGGRYSPAKRSSYKLNIQNLEGQNLDCLSTAHLANENIMLATVEDYH